MKITGDKRIIQKKYTKVKEMYKANKEIMKIKAGWKSEFHKS